MMSRSGDNAQPEARPAALQAQAKALFLEMDNKRQGWIPSTQIACYLRTLLPGLPEPDLCHVLAHFARRGSKLADTVTFKELIMNLQRAALYQASSLPSSDLSCTSVTAMRKAAKPLAMEIYHNGKGQQLVLDNHTCALYAFRYLHASRGEVWVHKQVGHLLGGLEHLACKDIGSSGTEEALFNVCSTLLGAIEVEEHQPPASLIRS